MFGIWEIKGEICIIKELNCIYIQALNRSNAIKRLRKLGYNID